MKDGKRLGWRINAKMKCSLLVKKYLSDDFEMSLVSQLQAAFVLLCAVA